MRFTVRITFVLAILSIFHDANACGNTRETNLINDINYERSKVGMPALQCDQNLEWLASKHVEDQMKWYNANGNNARLYDDSCNLHSWAYAGKMF